MEMVEAILSVQYLKLPRASQPNLEIVIIPPSLDNGTRSVTWYILTTVINRA
jgi:hypothetical protein